MVSEGTSLDTPTTYLFIQIQPFHKTPPATVPIIPVVKIGKMFLTQPRTYNATASAKIYHCFRFVKIEPFMFTYLSIIKQNYNVSMFDKLNVKVNLNVNDDLDFSC